MIQTVGEVRRVWRTQRRKGLEAAVGDEVHHCDICVGKGGAKYEENGGQSMDPPAAVHKPRVLHLIWVCPYK